MKLSKCLWSVVIFWLLLAPNVFAEEAIFAMGCFWSAEVAFRIEASNKHLPGIRSLTVGYAGGTEPNPTYRNHEGYREAIKIEFEPRTISYEKLLELFWHNIDPFDNGGQFCDRGPSYTSAIYSLSPRQHREAEIYKDRLEKKFKKKIATEILPYTTFYKAEEYHQNYQHKNPMTYKLYRIGCERDPRLQDIWSE